MIAVNSVQTLENYRLLLTFNTNESKIFDMNEYLDHGLFKQLKSKELFDTVRISFDTIQWANGLDLCPEVLYAKSKILSD